MTNYKRALLAQKTHMRQVTEPDAKPIDHVIGFVCALGLLIFAIVQVVEKAAA